MIMTERNRNRKCEAFCMFSKKYFEKIFHLNPLSFNRPVDIGFKKNELMRRISNWIIIY